MSCACCSHESKTTRYEPFIDRFVLITKCRLDNGPKIFKNPMGQPQDGTSSSLQSLPIELFQACLQFLDLGTLTAMRRVSQYTRHAIDTLHQYKELYEHAPQALRACLSTGLAAHIPICRLHHALTTMECHYCKTLTRVENATSYLEFRTQPVSLLYFCLSYFRAVFKSKYTSECSILFFDIPDTLTRSALLPFNFP